jgi:16S rRNA (uracil1498-N3)-methyltransferase
MNLILFEQSEVGRPLPLNDPRAQHLIGTLRRTPGQSFDVGMVNGPRGKAVIARNGAEGLELEFAWGEAPPPLPAVTLIVGLPRPQTARKILQEATALGVGEIWMVRSERSEPSYAESHLWTTGEWRRHLLAGAEQAFCTRLPEVRAGATLAEALQRAASISTRLALDNYESPEPLATVSLSGFPAALAVGPERGWSATDRQALRSAGFSLAHLGPRVLRVETACVAGLAILKSRLGL